MEQEYGKMRRFGDGSDAVMGACIEVHRTLGPGLESADQQGVAHELGMRRLRVERQVIESEVNDLGALPQRLRRADLAGGHPMAHVAPVTIVGRQIEVAPQAGHPARPVRLTIELPSDIWFPWVLGAARTTSRQ